MPLTREQIEGIKRAHREREQRKVAWIQSRHMHGVAQRQLDEGREDTRKHRLGQVAPPIDKP